MNSAITVELKGSTIAQHGHYEIDTRKGKSFKDPLGPMARLLLSEGFSPECRVHIVRDWGEGLKPVFKRDRTLAAWAGEDWRDHSVTGPYRSQYVPFSPRVGHSNTVGA